MRFCGLLAALVLALATGGCGNADYSFDAATWRASAGCGDDERLAMVGALERGVLRPGMAETEVVAVLGRPEARSSDRLVYCLGRGMIDYEEYWIELAPDGTVVAFRQVQG